MEVLVEVAVAEAEAVAGTTGQSTYRLTIQCDGDLVRTPHEVGVATAIAFKFYQTKNCSIANIHWATASAKAGPKEKVNPSGTSP